MSEWEPTDPDDPDGATEAYPGGSGPDDPTVPPGPGYVTEPVPDDEMEPWYRQRGPVAAVVGVGLAVLFFLVAFLIWVVAGDDEQLVGTESTTTTTSVVATVVPASTITTIAPATTTTPPTTEPSTTVPTTTEAPTTEVPRTTASPTIVAPPPPTPPPTTVAPALTPPPTTPPLTTAAPTTAPPTTDAPQVTVPPSSDATVWDIVAASPDLSRLRDLLVFADLDDVIDGDEPITLLAPSNDAFDLLESAPGGAELLGDRDRVRDLLRRHLVDDDAIEADDLFDLDEITVANGDRLPVDGDAGTVDGSRVVIADVDGANGVLHVLDRVMVP